MPGRMILIGTVAVLIAIAFWKLRAGKQAGKPRFREWYPEN